MKSWCFDIYLADSYHTILCVSHVNHIQLKLTRSESSLQKLWQAVCLQM